MDDFLHRDFLLDTPAARELYHEWAAPCAIIDYHCHLDPALIAADHRFGDITELWLGGDHYKWRAMRWHGVDERYITGDAPARDKFMQWAETVPYTLRNPLYHWTHLELRSAFGIDDRLNPQTAAAIFDECNHQLATRADLSARGLMRRYGVEVVCTTDDPIDDLSHHRRLHDEGFEIKVLPTWRPDKAMAIEGGDAFCQYVSRLGQVAGVAIASFAHFEEALRRRHDFFAAHGCRLSDHGLSEYYADDYTEADISRIFADALAGKTVGEADVRRFKSKMLQLFGHLDADKGWTQQYHYGPLRNTNSRMMAAVGPDTGFDSIGECVTAADCAKVLDRLDSAGALPKTILYNLHPGAYEVMATMAGNFQQGPVRGKVQLGSGWWFNDQLDGMTRQLNALSSLGLLSHFVGMLTDSRSFLSYPRHEYFRRCLCSLLGRDIEGGLLPYTGYERHRVQQMVADICHDNAARYFKF